MAPKTEDYRSVPQRDIPLEETPRKVSGNISSENILLRKIFREKTVHHYH